jgi:hypothetical protein
MDTGRASRRVSGMAKPARVRLTFKTYLKLDKYAMAKSLETLSFQGLFIF